MRFREINLDFLDQNRREEDLKKVRRYINRNQKIMFYRTNLFIHSRRVLWHVEKTIPEILSVYTDFNVELARTLALVHDDIEIITGDAQLDRKEKMSERELEMLDERETEAIPKMVERYGRLANGFHYSRLLELAKDKSTIEAQMVSFFDKFDGAGEAWHEVFAGNPYFLLPAGGHHGREGGYVRRLNEFPAKYPGMKPFFDKFSYYLPNGFDFESAQQKGKPHTKDSLFDSTRYPPYERWKRTIIQHEGPEHLTTQVEFESLLQKSFRKLRTFAET